MYIEDKDDETNPGCRTFWLQSKVPIDTELAALVETIAAAQGRDCGDIVADVAALHFDAYWKAIVHHLQHIAGAVG